MANGFRVVSDDIDPFLAEMVVRGGQEVTEAMRRGAQQVESYAKASAPWNDITGNAREGLYANVFEDLGEIILELGHTEEYGQWLETIQSGRYAVILPTLERMGYLLVRDAAGRFMKRGGSY